MLFYWEGPIKLNFSLKKKEKEKHFPSYSLYFWLFRCQKGSDFCQNAKLWLYIKNLVNHWCGFQKQHGSASELRDPPEAPGRLLPEGGGMSCSAQKHRVLNGRPVLRLGASSEGAGLQHFIIETAFSMTAPCSKARDGWGREKAEYEGCCPPHLFWGTEQDLPDILLSYSPFCEK